jgi:hypothetical protein
MLKHAGIEFSAVVDHSSGEIAVAYAAGVLSTDNAIRVAHYRGLHLKSISKSGAMMAVGTSYEDAKELVGLLNSEGRLKEAWEEAISPDVLSQYQIGPESDFFQAGRNSVLLVRLRAGIKTISIALFDLLESSTLKATAFLIS